MLGRKEVYLSTRSYFYYESVRIVCGGVLYFIVAVLLSYSDKFDTFFPLVRDDHRFRLICFEPEKTRDA